MFFNRNKDDWKKWAEQNGLKYLKEIKLGFLRSENVSIVDIVWGVYRDRRIYLFTVVDSTGSLSKRTTYFNDNFYSKVSINDKDQLLTDKNFLEIVSGVFGNESEIEVIQVLTAKVYLVSGLELKYEEVKEIYKLLWKFYNSKTGLKDKLIGGLAGAITANIKFNSPEAINFVRVNIAGKIDDSVIQEVVNSYEILLDTYNKETA